MNPSRQMKKAICRFLSGSPYRLVDMLVEQWRELTTIRPIAQRATKLEATNKTLSRINTLLSLSLDKAAKEIHTRDAEVKCRREQCQKYIGEIERLEREFKERTEDLKSALHYCGTIACSDVPSAVALNKIIHRVIRYEHPEQYTAQETTGIPAAMTMLCSLRDASDERSLRRLWEEVEGKSLSDILKMVEHERLPLDEYFTTHDNPKQKTFKIAPIAEWLGVGISEVAGNVPKTWRGKTYSTDGKTTLVKKNDNSIVQFGSDREAKDAIEAMTVVERSQYCSIHDLFRSIGQPFNNSLKTVWDDDGQCFVQRPKSRKVKR